MNAQHRWLFELPLVTTTTFDDRSLRRSEGEWELQELSYLNAELEEEYRRYNRLFRRTIAKDIGNTKKHPLEFLIRKVAGKFVYKKARDRQVDAGHITPVITMKKRGQKTERLAIQDRSLNRSDGAKMGAVGKGKRIKVLDIAGVPVDLDTVIKYVRLGLLHRKWLQAKPHEGWKAPVNKELFFALGEANDWISY